MSDRRVVSPDMALVEKYGQLTGDLRSVERRAAWPTPVQLDIASTPAGSTPAPTYVDAGSIDAYDAYSISVEVAAETLQSGRWYIVAASSQRFTRSSGQPIAFAYQYLLVDGVVVRSESTWDGAFSTPTQMSHTSSLTVTSTNPIDVRLRVAAAWTWIGFADPAPSQSLRSARIVGYPG